MLFWLRLSILGRDGTRETWMPLSCVWFLLSCSCKIYGMVTCFGSLWRSHDSFSTDFFWLNKMRWYKNSSVVSKRVDGIRQKGWNPVWGSLPFIKVVNSWMSMRSKWAIKQINRFRVRDKWITLLSRVKGTCGDLTGLLLRNLDQGLLDLEVKERWVWVKNNRFIQKCQSWFGERWSSLLESTREDRRRWQHICHWRSFQYSMILGKAMVQIDSHRQ